MKPMKWHRSQNSVLCPFVTLVIKVCLSAALERIPEDGITSNTSLYHASEPLFLDIQINNDSSSGSLIDGVVYDGPKRAFLESYRSTLESLENIRISNDTNNVNLEALNLDEVRNIPPSSPGWSSLEPVMDSDYELALASVLVNKNHSHPESSRNTVSSHIFAPTKNNKDDVAEVLTTEEDSETATTRVKWSDWGGDSETRRVNSTTNFTGLGSLLDLYNPYRLSESWEVLKARVNLSRQCGEEYGTFLEELHRGTPWALKVDDATGRYTTGFFFGNSFWLGSASLCESLGVRDPRNTSLPSPFLLGFYKLRVELGLVAEISPNIRNLHIGLCLPYSCNSEDAQLLLELSSLVGNELRTVEVSNVRSPHHSYNIWEDTTFWILVGFSAFIAVMLVIGTCYDLYLEHKSTHSFSNNISYEIARIGQPAINKAECLDPAKGLTVTSNNNNISNEMKESNGNIAIYNRSICNEVLPPQNIEDTPQLSIWSEVVLSFSVRLNLKTICDQTVGEDTIPTIHGLRSISMAWVILGHTCIGAFKFSDNMEYRGLVEKEFLFQTISNGAFSVDTFFFISGVLVSFLYFRTVAKIDVTKLTMSTGVLSNFMQFLGLLGYRFLRLTVPYMFVLGLAEVSMKWFYFNSVFEPHTLDHINCPNYWWRNLLYINTLFPVEDMCMMWSWYLANDTQFFILGAVLLILAVSHFRIAAFTLLTFLLSSWFTTGIIAYHNKYIPSMDPLALFDKIYDKPWTRLGPYLVGMSVGWILYKTNCKITMNKLVVTIGWLTSTSLFVLLIYGLYDAHLHPITAAVYSSLSHSAWALGLSWIVVACSTGYGGYVDKLLSLSILYPFSRVTYCAYLVHPIVIRVMAMKMDSPLHLSKETVMILFLGQAVASYILAFVVSITYEAPIVSLLKICSPKKKKRSYPVAQ